MRRARARASLTVVVALALALGACTPLYLPPVPGDALTPEARLRLGGASTLEAVQAQERLHLRLELLEIPHPGWLAVQWYGPAGAVRASESAWIEPADAGTFLELRSPPALTVTSGEWRAVVSWYGTIVRQLRVVVD